MATGKRYRAAVIGGSGYGGAELIRRLLFHPDVELVRVASVDLVGEPLAAAIPSLEQLTPLRFEDLAPAEAARGVDVVLLGLPHTVAATKVPELVAIPGLKLVDMSGDFRLKDAQAYQRWYRHQHPCPALLDDFVYGLPELNRERIRTGRLVASPGCFATTVELMLLPLARAGLLSGVVHVQGITGSSGSGAAPSAGTHHPVRAGNLKSYKPLEHQHVPEITETLAQAGARDLQLRFVPVSAPLSRGILATGFVELPEDWTQARLDALYREAWAGEPFVRVPARRLPEVAAVSGSNHAEVGVVAGAAHRGARTVTVFGALDNLVKGGAGQAIQSMNLLLGLDERASLADPRTVAAMKTIVIKLGGELVQPSELDLIAADLKQLIDGWHRVVIVHGGGPQASALQKTLGLTTRMIAGRRYTDAATLDVMKYVLAGQLNVDLCARLLARGVMPVGLHGASGHMVQAVRRPPRVMQGAGPDPVDLGLVGDVTGFNLPLLGDLFERRYVPVIACLGCDRDGQVLNINGDTVASQLAGALKADALVLVTSTPGVLRDVKDPSSRLPRIGQREFERLVADGTISGGMIPKLEESFAILAGGAKSVVIIGQLRPGDLARAVLEPGSAGTVLEP